MGEEIDQNSPVLDTLDGGGELARKLGIEFTELAVERLVATMPVAGNPQPAGLLHGGASAVLAETLGSVAAALLAGPDNVAMGIELNCTHHRAATQGLVTGVCTPLHVGRTVSSFEIVLTGSSTMNSAAE